MSEKRDSLKVSREATFEKVPRGAPLLGGRPPGALSLAAARARALWTSKEGENSQVSQWGCFWRRRCACAIEVSATEAVGTKGRKQVLWRAVKLPIDLALKAAQKVGSSENEQSASDEARQRLKACVGASVVASTLCALNGALLADAAQSLPRQANVAAEFVTRALWALDRVVGALQALGGSARVSAMSRALNSRIRRR